MKTNIIHLDLVSANANRSHIRLDGSPLGSGADAGVYRIANHSDVVAKIYHDPEKDRLRRAKIQAMMAAVPDLPRIRENNRTYIQIAWPTGILTDKQDKFVGYAMPFVDLKYSTVLENLLAAKTRRLMGLPEFYGFRVIAAANLAALVESLHKCNHHIIDLKPVNLNVYLDTFYTALLDCDGLSIQGPKTRFAAHQYTDGYIAPEAMQQQLPPQELGEYQDRFALAVVIFQLLNQGIHPYQGIPASGVPPTTSERIRSNLYAYGKKANSRLKPSPWSIHAFFEDATRRLFDRAFGLQPLSRPTAQEWRTHLRQLLDTGRGRLKRCLIDPNHAHFSKGCGLCRLEKGLVKTQPAPLKKKRAKNPARIKKITPRTAHRAAPLPQRSQHHSAATRAGCARNAWSMAITLVTLLVGVHIYHIFNNIHTFIKRNDIERFDRAVRQGRVTWSKITRDDAMAAMNFSDDQILVKIIERIPSLPQDYEFITRLIDSRHERALTIYEQQLRENAKENHKKNTGQGFNDIFLSGDIRYIESILRGQADPNVKIQLPVQHGLTTQTPSDRILSAIVDRPGNMTNYQWFYESNSSPVLRAVMEKFGQQFRIPATRTDMILYQIASYMGWDGKSRRDDYSFERFIWIVRPVHIAALNNDEHYMRLLINHGANLSDILFDGRSAVQLTQSPRIYEMLKIGREKLSPFFQSIADDDIELFQSFMRNSPQTRVKPDDPDPLDFAIDHGSLRIVDMFYRQYGKKFDKDDARLLGRAYNSENPMLLAYLLEKGINLNQLLILNDLGQIFNEKKWIFALAMAYKSGKLNEYLYKKYRIGLYLENKAMHYGRWDVVQILDAYESNWQTLHYAVVRQDLETIKSIIKNNPHAINSRDTKGRTPLILASYYDCEASARLLMNYVQDISQEDSSGYSALHYAAYNGNIALVQKLIQEGAGQVNKDDPNCQSALDKVRSLNNLYTETKYALREDERAPFEAELNRRHQTTEYLRQYWQKNPDTAQCKQKPPRNKNPERKIIQWLDQGYCCP